jgi:hypothetical protein
MSVLVSETDPGRSVVALSTTSDDEGVLGAELEKFDLHPQSIGQKTSSAEMVNR